MLLQQLLTLMQLFCTSSKCYGALLFENLTLRVAARGAGGGTTYKALKGADAAWEKVRTMQASRTVCNAMLIDLQRTPCCWGCRTQHATQPCNVTSSLHKGDQMCNSQLKATMLLIQRNPPFLCVPSKILEAGSQCKLMIMMLCAAGQRSGASVRPKAAQQAAQGS